MTQIVIPMNEWINPSSLEYFKRNPNTIKVPQTVRLSSDTLVKVMAKSFEVVTRDAHYVTFASRVILADRLNAKIYNEDEIFKAESAINKHFDSINDYFDTRVRQAEQKLAHAGINPDSVERVTQAYEALCTSRTATDFLQLLTKADIYLGMHHYLWVIGELSDNREEAMKAKLNNEREVRNYLYSIPRVTTKNFDILRRICNAVMAERKVAREKQSLHDKRRMAEQERMAARQQELDEMNVKRLPVVPQQAVAMSA